MPEGAGIERRPSVVGSSAVVVPDEASSDRFAAPSARGYGIRLGLHLVKGIGEAEGEQLDEARAGAGPFHTLADLAARTELSEEVLERLIRAGALDSLGQPRRQALWQLREVAGAARGRSITSGRARGRPLDIHLPATAAPALPPPTELERLDLIDEYKIPVHPRIAGHGPTLFAGLSKHLDLRLVGRHEFESGAVALRYEPRNPRAV